MFGFVNLAYLWFSRPLSVLSNAEFSLLVTGFLSVGDILVFTRGIGPLCLLCIYLFSIIGKRYFRIYLLVVTTIRCAITKKPNLFYSLSGLLLVWNILVFKSWECPWPFLRVYISIYFPNCYLFIIEQKKMFLYLLLVVVVTIRCVIALYPYTSIRIFCLQL